MACFGLGESSAELLAGSRATVPGNHKGFKRRRVAYESSLVFRLSPSARLGWGFGRGGRFQLEVSGSIMLAIQPRLPPYL